MSSEAPNIVDAALSLSDTERAQLAYRLLQSLKPDDVLDERSPDFQEELDRRVADYDSGKTHASDWDDVAARMRESLKSRSPS